MDLGGSSFVRIDDTIDEEILDNLNRYQSDYQAEVFDESEDETVDLTGKITITNNENSYKRALGAKIALSNGITSATKEHLLDVLTDFIVIEVFQVKQMHNKRKNSICKDESC